jgi:hypothetical protein
MTRAPWQYSAGDYAPCSKCAVIRPLSGLTDGACTDGMWCEAYRESARRPPVRRRNGTQAAGNGPPSDERGPEVGGDGSKRQKGNQEG